MKTYLLDANICSFYLKGQHEDILIGSTSIANGMVMVTNNVQHLGRLEGIVIEDWTKQAAQ